ncbi:MAG: exodeoxyribonuclease Xth [Nonomuraea muscovyensis]|nr:exodeoxyribonuclease Xth [Nonomuraea muscovyensis]
MLVVTWNVNSLRMRLGRVLAFLERHRPDVVCLQETKMVEADFPFGEFAALGYHCLVYGQHTRNGVAIISAVSGEDVARGFPGDPLGQDARVIGATIGGVRIVCLYAVNGRTVGSAEYATKLRWYEALRAWLRTEYDPALPLLLVGDFNIAPDDRDVHDPLVWQKRIMCSEEERQELKALMEWGLTDLTRLHEPGPGPFTWWDYRQGAFHRGWGLRIDLALGTHAVAEISAGVRVDRDERKPTFGPGKPSDHAPVLVTLRPPASG